MKDTRLIRCKGVSEKCFRCEVTVNENGQFVGSCGYVLTADDKRRILQNSMKKMNEVSE